MPLPEKIMSDVPAFNIRPGMPIAVDENLWESHDSSLPSIIQDFLSRPSGKYTSWPTSAAEGSHIHATNGPVCEQTDQSIFAPAVSTGAKAIVRATPLARQALPCVHEGFLENYSRLRHEVVQAIMAVLKRQLDKSVERRRHDGGTEPLALPKIYITGKRIMHLSFAIAVYTKPLLIFTRIYSSQDTQWAVLLGSYWHLIWRVIVR